tara:strand:- start:384 stop:1112 length:729 start_codon:yes stop_codon:yes gene_type:complete
MNSVSLPKNVSVDEITFSKAKPNKYGGKSVYINYKGKPLTLQTPYMSTPFGLSEFVNQETGQSKYSLDFSFRNMDESRSVEHFFDFLEKFDKRLVKTAAENCVPWFSNKDYNNEDILSALFSNQIRYSTDRETGELNHKYAPTFKLKIPFYNDKFNVEVYDSNNKPVHDDLVSVLPKNTMARALMTCTGVWFAGGKFGVSWRLVHLQVQKKVSMDDYSFIQDSDAEDEPEVDVGEQFYGIKS